MSSAYLCICHMVSSQQVFVIVTIIIILANYSLFYTFTYKLLYKAIFFRKFNLFFAMLGIKYCGLDNSLLQVPCCALLDA
jgi:hypothetical protein